MQAAFTHTAQLATIVIPIAIGAFTLSVTAAVVVFFATELLLLVLLPNMRAFRREVDGRIDLVAYQQAAMARASWLSRMTEVHRAELEQLENLAVRVRRSTTVEDPMSAPAAERGEVTDWLGLENLLAMYVDLAIRYRENAIAFRPFDDVQLDREIIALETKTQASPRELEASRYGDRACLSWASSRLRILRERRETRRRAHEARHRIGEQLATIAACIRWMYEEAAVGLATTSESCVAHSIAMSIENGHAIREVAACGEAQPIDPAVLTLSWRARTAGIVTTAERRARVRGSEDDDAEVAMLLEAPSDRLSSAAE